jgi:N-acylneuraminate cytidylyltransferase
VSASVVALVPARSGSKRIPRKNVRELRGHPLLAYTLAAARRSGAFSSVVVSTDDPDIAAVARAYGAEVPFLRPPDLAADTAPDIGWVRHALDELRAAGRPVDAFAILRPTNPLRSAQSIVTAVRTLLADPQADSLRAVQRVSEHPGKMWVLAGDDRMTPLLDDDGADPPWHSTPYQALPPVHVQNASLEVAWARTVDEQGTIAGRVVRPWVTPGHEGLDLNEEIDWLLLERLLDAGDVDLPQPDQPPTGHPAPTTPRI